MAKRSDFAQKLLDDLRIRKERMTASQSSKSSKPIAGDAYSHSKKAYRGSREMKLHQNTNLKSGRTQSRSTRGNKSVSIRESSQDIIPLGRGRSSEQSEDLFMALTFALENGGKLIRTDSSSSSLMLGFLNQIGRRSEQMTKMERINNIAMQNTSTSQFPSLSRFHIKEIAKGVQKLNQILRACSNGLNFDRFSIEIGRELLKGAVDLEESLRMLGNLQESSEYMIGPQNKAKITLLDDGNDDNENTVKTTESKQLARPIFSFDKPSRNFHHIQEIKQMLMALTQPENENYGENRKNLGTSNPVSQRISSSNSPSMQTFAAFSEQKNHSSSTKMGRIPNVIAKLMGLEELPENDDANHFTKKDSAHKEKIERAFTKKTEGSTAQEWKTKDAWNMETVIRKHKQTKPSQIQVIQDSRDFQAQMYLASCPSGSDGALHDSKTPQKDVGKTKLSGFLKKVTDKHQNNNDQSTLNIGSHNNIWGRERKLDNAKLKEQKGQKGKPTEPIAKHQLQKMTSCTEKASDAAITLQGQTKSNSAMLKAERRNAYEQPLDSLTKSWPKLIQGHLYSVKKPSYTSHKTSSIGSSIDLTKGTQSMGLPNRRHKEDVVQDRNSLNSNTSMQDSLNKNSIQNSYPRNLDSEVIKQRTKSTITTDMEKKIIHKVKVTRVQKVETPRKIDELVTRSTNLHKLARISKHQSPTLQEVAQIRHNELGQSNEDNKMRPNRSRELEAKIIKSSKLELTIARKNKPREVQIQAEQDSSFCDPPADKLCHDLARPKILAEDGHGILKLSTMIDDLQSQGVDQKIQSHKNDENLLNRICGNSINATHSQLQKRDEQVLETPEPLTESENNLIQILVNSQLFLDTAEALFKLNIPLSIPHANSNDCHYEGSNLTLDCSYEVMKRKGKMNEYSQHPFNNSYITSLKIRSLNDLIKQLHKDLDKLKFHGRNDKVECTIEDTQAKMLESDVHHKDPDVNCMWDFGWHKMMFMSLEKEDVIKDVEKRVLNGLLDELSKDLAEF